MAWKIGETPRKDVLETEHAVDVGVQRVYYKFIIYALRKINLLDKKHIAMLYTIFQNMSLI